MISFVSQPAFGTVFEHEGQFLLPRPPNNGGRFAVLGRFEKRGQSLFYDVAWLGKPPARLGDNLLSLLMVIFKCWRHRAHERDARGTVVQESGDDFPALQVDERLAGNFRAKRVFKKHGVMSAHAKDEQIARVA